MSESKRPLLISLAVFFVSTALTIYACWDLSHSPAVIFPLEADPPEIDFGTVQEEQVRGSTRLTNRSQKPIRLLHVLVSCSCSEVKLRQGELLPGKSEVLSASLDLRGRRGTTGTSIDVVFVTEEGVQWTLPLTLRATVSSNVNQDRSTRHQ